MAKMTPHDFFLGLSDIDSTLSKWQVKLAHTTIDELEDQWRSSLKVASTDAPQEGALEEWVEATDMNDVPKHTTSTAAGKAAELADTAKGGPPKGELPKEAELLAHIKQATNANVGDATLVNMGSSPKSTADKLQFGSNVGEKVQRDSDITKKLFANNQPTTNAERLSEGSSNTYNVEPEPTTQQGEKTAAWEPAAGAVVGGAVGTPLVGAPLGALGGYKVGKGLARRRMIRRDARAAANKQLEAEKPAISRRVKKELKDAAAAKAKKLAEKTAFDLKTVGEYAKATGIGAGAGAALGAAGGALSTPNYGDKKLTNKERMRRALIGAGVGAGVGGAAGAGIHGAKSLRGARIGKLTALGSGDAMMRARAHAGMLDAAKATQQSVANRAESWKGLSGLSRRLGSTGGKWSGAQAYRTAQAKGREIAAKVPQHFEKAQSQLEKGRLSGVRTSHGVPSKLNDARKAGTEYNLKSLDLADQLTRRHPNLMKP